MTERIPIFPLHTLLLPYTDLGLHVFEDRYRALVAHSLSNGHTFGVLLIRKGREVGGPAETFDTGTLAQITGYARLPDGRYLLEVEGNRRFEVERVVNDAEYPAAEVRWLDEPIGNFSDARKASADVSRLFRLYRVRSGDGDLPVNLPADPVARSYLIASLLRIDLHEKQELLEVESACQRLAGESEILRRELALLEHLRMRR